MTYRGALVAGASVKAFEESAPSTSMLKNVALDQKERAHGCSRHATKLCARLTVPFL